MKIAITFRDDRPLHQLVYSNGIAQNTKFLYDLLELIGCEPFFLRFGETPAHDFALSGKQYESITFRELIDNPFKVPVVLEVAVTLNPDHRDALRLQCGSKIVSVRYGNSLVLDAEELLFNGSNEGRIHVSGPDRVWMSPHHIRNKSYLETIYQAEVDVCPFIWEPDFISPGFSETVGDRQPDIYVMEPNINVMKSALIPLCIISRLYQENPGVFCRAIILNSLAIKDKPFFLNNIVANLPGLSNVSNKVFFSDRATFDETFKRNDILLGHHWECALNYLYLEALYKGVGLVHNSEFLKDVGYFYSDCDIKQGVAACMAATSSYQAGDAPNGEGRERAINNFSIYNLTVQNRYRQLLEAVLNR